VSWSWAFLVVTLIGAWFTFNAYVPLRRRGVGSVASFLAGWLTAELPVHHFAWQVAATVFFVWMGALSAWPGWVGLAITGASWAGLGALALAGERSRERVERSLREALGDDYAAGSVPGLPEGAGEPVPVKRLIVPVRFREPEVEVIRDLPYAADAGARRRLDVYARRDAPGGAPILLQVHGGAWVMGHKRQQALPLLMHLAARGWVCVAANYRLAPRAPFPAQIEDLKRAIAWIREHGPDYGGDPGFLAVTGGSAGGHLSALLALTAGDPRYQPGFEDADTGIQACVPFYGVYDFTDRHGHDAGNGLRRFLERVVMKRRFADDPEAFERASPLHRVHPDAPPFFVIHGTHDSLAPVAEARDFVRELRRTSRQPVAYLELPLAQHAFEVFHSLRTRHVVAGVGRFLGWAYARQVEARPSSGSPPGPTAQVTAAGGAT